MYKLKVISIRLEIDPRAEELARFREDMERHGPFAAASLTTARMDRRERESKQNVMTAFSQSIARGIFLGLQYLPWIQSRFARLNSRWDTFLNKRLGFRDQDFRLSWFLSKGIYPKPGNLYRDVFGNTLYRCGEIQPFGNDGLYQFEKVDLATGEGYPCRASSITDLEPFKPREGKHYIFHGRPVRYLGHKSIKALDRVRLQFSVEYLDDKSEVSLWFSHQDLVAFKNPLGFDRLMNSWLKTLAIKALTFFGYLRSV
ncbi:MAG: hypothetical protein HQ596_03705 [Candidatus Saganbacteria bacterium]|nr:hypothetical protein [Candidatus Saganbacteria bacterium]